MQVLYAPLLKGNPYLIQHLDFLYSIIKESYDFSSSFNKQIELRNQLWQEGFIAEMKQLPGLLKQ